MTMQPQVEYQKSPLHQGSRSRSGDQVDGQFVHDFLGLLGDCRLLWVPGLTDTTMSTDKSRHAATITWSESLSSFDVPPTRLGAGVAVPFNGTDEEGGTPDADRLSFGDGLTDEPFSVVALVKPDANDALMTIVAKADSSSAEEWLLRLDASGHPEFALADESATAFLELRQATAFGTAWGLLAGVYDGSGAVSGMRLYKDAASVADTDDSSGAYMAMENTAASVHFGARYTSKEQFFDGSVGLIAIIGRQLSQENLWAVKALCNSYFDLSL